MSPAVSHILETRSVKMTKKRHHIPLWQPFNKKAKDAKGQRCQDG